MRPVVETVDPAEGFLVNFIWVTGETQSDRIKGEQTIQNLKAELEDIRGIPVDQLRLIYGGRQLEDYRTVNDYGIQSDESIHVVLRLTGGGALLPRAFNTVDR